MELKIDLYYNGIKSSDIFSEFLCKLDKTAAVQVGGASGFCGSSSSLVVVIV